MVFRNPGVGEGGLDGTGLVLRTVNEGKNSTADRAEN